MFLGFSRDWWLQNYKFDFEAGTVHRIGKKRLIVVGRFDRTSGYYRFGFAGKECALHRLVYFAYHGKLTEGLVIDHIDGDRTNNSISNLREVTVKENSQNTGKFKRGACPANGIWLCRVVGKGGKVLHISEHKTEDEAHNAYLKFKMQLLTKPNTAKLIANNDEWFKYTA